MAITIDWSNSIINIPRADLALIQSTPTEIRQLDLNDFRLELKDLEDSSDGMAWTRTHKHNTTVTVGGVTLARVIEILEPYTITFEDGAYAVNLVGANSNVADRVNVNQVSIRSSNSAGLQDLSTLLAAAYQGQVVVDVVDGQPGTSTPVGTFFAPVDNMNDAIVIAKDNGIKNIVIAKTMTIDEDLSGGYSLIGNSIFNVITVNSQANLNGASIDSLTVNGELDGLNVVRNCILDTVTDLSGFIEKCSFKSTLTLNGDIIIMECYSDIPGSGYPVVNNISGATIEIRDFHGSIGINGVVDGSHVVGVYGGKVIIESGCTGGTIYIRGDAFDIVDNSGAGCTVVDERSVNPTASAVADAVWGEDITTHTTTNSAAEELKKAKQNAALAVAVSA